MADKTDITPEQQVELQGDLLSDGSLSSTGSSQPTKVAALPDNVPGPQAEVMGGHSEDTESQRSSPVDPILELLEFSEDIMCPDVSNILIGQLEGNHNPTPVLLELARFFRAQACLLREQAKILDELAISDTIEGPDTDIDEGLYRNRVAHFVKLSCGAMVAAHDHIDALEDSVYPWNETYGKLKGKKLRGKRTKPVNGYTAFLHMNLKSCDSASGSRQAIFKSLAARWKALDKNARSKYDEVAMVMNKEKEERMQASKRAKIDEG